MAVTAKRRSTLKIKTICSHRRTFAAQPGPIGGCASRWLRKNIFLYFGGDPMHVWHLFVLLHVVVCHRFFLYLYTPFLHFFMLYSSKLFFHFSLLFLITWYNFLRNFCKLRPPSVMLRLPFLATNPLARVRILDSRPNQLFILPIQAGR